MLGCIGALPGGVLRWGRCPRAFRSVVPAPAAAAPWPGSLLDWQDVGPGPAQLCQDPHVGVTLGGDPLRSLELPEEVLPEAGV